MEFEVFKHFKDLERLLKECCTPRERSTAYFLSGQMGGQISPRLDGFAARAKLSRRNFLQSVCGLTGAMLAVNQITGMRFFDVQEAEAYDLAAAAEGNAFRQGGKELIIDTHTHICWRRDGFVPGVNVNEKGMWFVKILDDLGKGQGLANGIQDMTAENFGKLVFNGSDTSIAIVNPFGFREDYGGQDMMPLEDLVEVKNRWPDRVIMLGGGLTPNQGLEATLERLQMFVERYRIEGLKLYTFDSTPQRGWWFDDQKLAYPIWERCRKLGLKNIGCHKGVPFGQFMARYAHPGDFDAVADDFPDMNWIAFHGAWPYQQELAELKAFKPHRKNLFGELGTCFAATVTNQPLECAHLLGTLLRDLGPDYILWGTDALLWGSPQWQIEAFRRFRIPDELVAGYGYPQLTDEVKHKVLGGNAARLWAVRTANKTHPSMPPPAIGV